MTSNEKIKIWKEEKIKQPEELKEKLTKIHNKKNYAFEKLQTTLQNIQYTYHQINKLYKKKEEENSTINAQETIFLNTQETINFSFNKIRDYYKKAIKLTQEILETTNTENKEATYIQTKCKNFLEKSKTIPYTKETNK